MATIILVVAGLFIQSTWYALTDQRNFELEAQTVVTRIHQQLSCQKSMGVIRTLGTGNQRIQQLLNRSLPPAGKDSLRATLEELKEQVGASLIYVMSADGDVVISTATATDPDGIAGNNYSFRPYFRHAIEGQTVYQPALGVTTLERGIYLSGPVIDSTNQDNPQTSVIGAIVIKLPEAFISAPFASISGKAALVSPHGYVFASSEDNWIHKSIRIPDQTPLIPNPTKNPEYFTSFFKQANQPLEIKLNAARAQFNQFAYRVSYHPVDFDLTDNSWTLVFLRRIDHRNYPYAEAGMLAIVLVLLGLTTTSAMHFATKHRESEKNKAQLIAQSAETYKSIFTTTTDAILVHDPLSGTVLEANPVAMELFGYQPDDLPRLDYRHEFPYPAQTAKHAIHAALAGRQQYITFQGKKQNNTPFWAEAWFKACMINGKSRVIAILHDITETRKAHDALAVSNEKLENEIKNRTAQLIQAQKMAAMGKMAEKLTHDITNIVTRINGYAELIKHAADPQSSIPESADQIIDATHEVSHMTADLLAFSHPASLELKEMDIVTTLKAVERLISAMTPSNVTLRFELPDKKCPVMISTQHIEQALVHLVVNSFEAMPDGGRATISLYRPPMDATPFINDDPNNKLLSPADFITIDVSNSGPAIADDDVHRIFDPFFSTKNDSRSRGLGLSIVYVIMSRHRGGVQYLREGNANVFRLWLPAKIHAPDL